MNSIARFSLPLALLVSGFTLAPAPSRADELIKEMGKLESLTVEQAKTLAQHDGWLSLDRLTMLSEEAAKELAQHNGDLLSLNGLTVLEDAAATALSQHRGQLSLTGLTTLSAVTAKALATAASWNGFLPRLTAFESADSVAIAQALATTKGPLKLPNLKKISPKTLSALIEKRDVDFPLIETLELIPEPDGSVTEDFEIPEWLEIRQKQQRAARKQDK